MQPTLGAVICSMYKKKLITVVMYLNNKYRLYDYKTFPGVVTADQTTMLLSLYIKCLCIEMLVFKLSLCKIVNKKVCVF